MSVEKELRRIFYVTIQKADRTSQLTPKVRADISDVAKQLAATMEDIGLTITPVTALVEISNDNKG